jgi:hypothetical protein
MLIGYIGTVVQSQERRIRVSVLIDGVEQPLYRRMDGKVFVPTVPGKPYELRVQGLSDFVEVKCAVDGVDVFSGEPGNYQVGMGFIVHKTSKPLDGWYYNGDLVRPFTFGKLSRRIDVPSDNVGAIGFAAWCGQVPPEERHDLPGPDANQKDVEMVGSYFSRDARQEMDLLVIGYDTKGSLLKRGIIAPADPNPFPDVLTYNARNVYNL